MRRAAVVILAGAALAACGDGTGLNGGAAVSVAFESRSTATGANMLGFGGGSQASSVEVGGNNGVLSVDTVHVIINEFELERVEQVEDCDAIGTGDSCEDFEAPPSLMNLPLGSGSVTAVTAQIPPGAYDELEFEIEDLEDDEDDSTEAQQIEELFNDIRAQFGDWPRQASMRVAGTFTPTDGEPQRFVAYLAAEIEVELEFGTPFVVTEDDISRTITVELDPRDWFKLSNGDVINLAEHDYQTTGSVLEFEVEIENGFKSVEHDD